MRHIIAFLLFMAVAMPVWAADGGFQGGTAAPKSGFHGPISGAQAETVEKALTLPDDAPVVLTGNIISQVAGEKNKYNFKDATGEMVVEIKNSVFMGKPAITPGDKVRIAGKIDKDFGQQSEVDVKVLDLVK